MHWKTIGEHLDLQCSTEKDSECFRIVLQRWLMRSKQLHCRSIKGRPYIEDLIGILDKLNIKSEPLQKCSTLMSKEREKMTATL